MARRDAGSHEADARRRTRPTDGARRSACRRRRRPRSIFSTPTAGRNGRRSSRRASACSSRATSSAATLKGHIARALRRDAGLPTNEPTTAVGVHHAVPARHARPRDQVRRIRSNASGRSGGVCRTAIMGTDQQALNPWTLNSDRPLAMNPPVVVSRTSVRTPAAQGTIRNADELLLCIGLGSSTRAT